MAEYLRPKPGGALCPDCGELTAAYRVLPVQDGCRVRYHRCVCCGYLFKSVEKAMDNGQLTMDNEERKTG
jgi:Zn ribbon nucleic-acid-binding protein